MKQHTSLSDRIGAKKYHMVMSILSNNKEIDVTYNEGEFFIIGIKQNSTDIVKALLDYFKQNQLTNYGISKVEDMSKEDQLLTIKIRNILDVATQDVELSREMKEILSPYIDFEGSEHSNSILEDDKIDNDFILKDQAKFTTFKRSHSADDFNNSTFDNSKENLLTEENLKRFSNDLSEEKFKFIENVSGHHNYQDTRSDDLLHKGHHHTDLAGNLHNNDEF